MAVTTWAARCISEWHCRMLCSWKSSAWTRLRILDDRITGYSSLVVQKIIFVRLEQFKPGSNALQGFTTSSYECGSFLAELLSCVLSTDACSQHNKGFERVLCRLAFASCAQKLCDKYLMITV